MRKIRVLIADDHAVLRAGLWMLIDVQPDMKVVGEAADGGELLRKLRPAKPDVVLLDLAMPSGGTQAIPEVLRARPGARVLVLTMFDDPAYARASLAAGASGYIAKKAADNELLSAIRAVHRGRTFVNVSLERSRAPGPREKSVVRRLARASAGTLSQREHQVFDLLARGHTNREIAERIGVGVKTAETYRSRIGQKLGLLSRADIVAYALETGLLAPTRPGKAD